MHIAKPIVSGLVAAVAVTVILFAPPVVRAQGQSGPVYRCPGNLYTSELTAKQADEKGCRTIEGAPITVIQGNRPRSGEVPAKQSSEGRSPAEAKVDPSAQRARDSDARRILESELRREEERLAQLQKDFNGGQPERQGDERNFQKYMDRVADMKAAIARKESDIAAIKRELAKLPAS